MNLEVLLQVWPGRKLFIASFAHIGFLPSVNTLVADQVRHLRKGLVAAIVLASIRFLFIMDSSVLLKRWILCKGLVAQITILLHKYIVYKRRLGVQTLNPTAALPFERSVLVVRALMFLERLLAVEELVTALVGAWEKHRLLFSKLLQQMFLLWTIEEVN